MHHSQPASFVRPVALLFVLAVTGTAEAQSFDCAKARSPTEIAICGDHALGALDTAVAAAYRALLDRHPEDRPSLVADQRRWVAARDQHCRDTTGDSHTACLTNEMQRRLATLNAPREGICEAIAAAVPGLARSTLSGGPAAGLETAGTFTRAPDTTHLKLTRPREQILAWARGQHLTLDPALVSELPESTSGTAALEQLPGTDFYAVDVIEGTAMCYGSTYFQVTAGTARLVDAPPGFGEEAGGCMVRRAYVGFRGTPLLVADDSTYGPDLTSHLRVADWDPTRNGFHAFCGVEITYEPEVSAETLNQWDERCAPDACPRFRRAAREFAERTVHPPVNAPDDLAAWSAADRGLYEQMLRRAEQRREDETARTTPEQAAQSPHRYPYRADGITYLVTVGNYSIGWRQYADLAVDFEVLDGGTLRERAEIPVGVAKAAIAGASAMPSAPSPAPR